MRGCGNNVPARKVSPEESKTVVSLLLDSIDMGTPRCFPLFTRVRLLPWMA